MAGRRSVKATSTAQRGGGAEGAPPPAPLGAALVVEDDPVIALLLADALRDCGADPVETCPNTECARIMLDRLSPAVLVLDSRLEDRDDGWALAELASIMGPPAPRVVFATAAPERIPPHIAALGVVLVKPFAPHQLIAAIAPRRTEGLLGRLRDALGGEHHG